MSQTPSSVALVATASVADEVKRRLAAAADDREHPMRLVVAATIGADGMPNARTLVLRGVDDGLARLWFHTDGRAAKVAELRRHPGMCVVAYDRRDGVQIVVRGRAIVRTDGPEADRHWQQVDLATRHLYDREHEAVEAGAAPEPMRSAAAGVETDPRTRAAIGRLEAEADTSRARRHFALIELSVESVDWFQTTTQGLRRAIMTATGGWVAIEVAV